MAVINLCIDSDDVLFSENKLELIRVLYISVEIDPFARTGGLADVARFLPKSLSKKVIDIRVIAPLFKGTYLKNVKLFRNCFINVGKKEQEYKVNIFYDEKVVLYFIDNTYYFGRDNMYGYDDEAERFIFFSRAVLDLIFFLDFKPDIIHLNDWHPAFIPFLLKTNYMRKNFYQNIKTIFTIHCFGYQGIFDKKYVEILFGMKWNEFSSYGIDHNGKISFIKAGLKFSDLINTVSINHAKELSEPIKNIAGRSDIVGITNGIDFDEFDPSTDRYIFSNYSIENINGKFVNKKLLQRAIGLIEDIDIPIIAIISRLDIFKGFDLIIDSYKELLKNNVQLIIMGDGNEKIKNMCINIEEEYPSAVRYFKYDKTFSRKIYAGADMFLMPSHFEACGTTQLISMRYATIPIARLTGGIVDTIKEFNNKSLLGCGFLFKHLDSEDMLKTIIKALNFYNNKKMWRVIMVNAMKNTKSWASVSDEYVKLYKKIIWKDKKIKEHLSEGILL